MSQSRTPSTVMYICLSWMEISELIGSRNRNAVYKFSKTVRGRRYRQIGLNIESGLIDLASGMRTVAEPFSEIRGASDTSLIHQMES